ncbi:MAG: CHAD domain-containing protein [Thermoflexales bacterium]
MDTVASLCERYGVDMLHARHVAALTRQLLEGARAWLPDPDRLIALGEIAAILHNVGMNLDAAHHHTVGRDIVASSEIEGVDATERAMLACAVRFHRKKVDPDAEPLMQALTDAQRHSTLLITAALRVADGLDYHGGQDTRIAMLEIRPEGALLRVRGAYCHENAARALAKAGVWNQVLPPLRIEARMDRPGADGDMPLGAAARRILRYLVDRRGLDALVSQAAGPGGETSDVSIRALRTGFRRLRTGARVFGRYAPAGVMRGLDARLREIGEAGGPARETEMMVGLLDAYLADAEPGAREALRSMRAVWDITRREARRVYFERLRGSGADAWLSRLAELDLAEDDSASPAAGQPRLLRHQAPAVLQRYLTRVRAFDTLSRAAPIADWHRYRIAVRRLRAVADLLRDALPAEQIKPILARSRETQDALGDLRDAHITAQAALQFVSALPSLDSEGSAAGRTGLAFVAWLQEKAAALQPARVERWE